MSNVPVGHTPSHSSPSLPPDRKDDKSPPSQPQAPLLNSLSAGSSAPALPAQPLRARLRKREEAGGGEPAPLSGKRPKAQVDYARLDSGLACDDDGPARESEDVRPDPGRAKGTQKRKDRKADGSDAEAEQEKPVGTVSKRRKAVRPKAEAVPIDAGQPIAEVGRLLGLPAGWDRPAQASSSSSSSSSAPAGYAVGDIEPAIDAATLAQTLRKAYNDKERGVDKLCRVLDTLIPTLRFMPPKAFEVATRAIGLVAGYRPTASDHLAERLCALCDDLAPQGARFAHLLVDELGDRFYLGSNARKQRLTVVDQLLTQGTRPSTEQIWNAVLGDCFKNGNRDGLDQLVLRVVEQGRNVAVAQQFFRCLGSLCRENQVRKERLHELLAPLIGTQARVLADADEHTRTSYLRSAFESLCDGLWNRGLVLHEHQALEDLWLSPQRPEELLARQQVMAPGLCKHRSTSDIISFAQSKHTRIDFHRFTSLLTGHFAHLLQAAKEDADEREALAQALPSCLDFLLDHHTAAECAGLMRQASLVLDALRETGTYAAFFNELLTQLQRRGMLAPGAGGEALLCASVKRATGHRHGPTDGYFEALTEFTIGTPPLVLAHLARVGAESISHSMATAPVERDEHSLLTPLFNKYAPAPDSPVGSLVEGFVRGLAGRMDLDQRLGKLFNGLAQGLGAANGAFARVLGQAAATGLGGPAIDAASLDACMAALLPRIRLLDAACVADVIEGLVAGLGGASLPQERVRQITRALHEAGAQAEGEPHENDNQARISLRTALGPVRYNESLALTQRPWDLPVATAASSTVGEAPSRIAALRVAVDALGPPPAVRPPLPEVCAHDRETARLWLAVDAERQALPVSASSSEQGVLRALLEATRGALQAHLPPPQAGLTPEDALHQLRQFQRRETTGLDTAARTQDAVVLGWRLGLGGEFDASQARARAALRERTDRLLQLAAPPATGAGMDPIFTGLLHAAIRPRQALEARPELLRSLLEQTIQSAASALPPIATGDRPRFNRFATALEWMVRSAATAGKPEDIAATAIRSLQMLHQAANSYDPTEARKMASRAVARGVDARLHDGALEKFIQAAAASGDGYSVASGLSDVIGGGEPLQRALHFVAALPDAGNASSIEGIVTALCHHEAPADVLFKAARDFSPAQKVALLRPPTVNSWMRRTWAQHLVAPPPQNHPRNCGGAKLTEAETREWAMALARAYSGADLGVLKAEFNVPAPVAHPAGASAPAIAEPVENARLKQISLEALEFVANPDYLIRTMRAEDMLATRLLAWLDVIYGDNRRMTPDFTRRQLTQVCGLPQYGLSQAERALRIESVLVLVRHGAERLRGVDLRLTRNFMLDQLRAMQADLTLDEDGQPSTEYAELYLRTSQAVTGLYTPAIYGRVNELDWAFKAPSPSAPPPELEAFRARAREGLNDVLDTRKPLDADIADIDSQFGHQTGRTDNLREMLSAREGLTRLVPPPPQLTAWLATLDKTVLDLSRATLLRETLGQMRAAMGALRSTLQTVVQRATEGAGPPAAAILPPPVPQEPEVQPLG